jgi:hypothetical protein
MTSITLTVDELDQRAQAALQQARDTMATAVPGTGGMPVPEHWRAMGQFGTYLDLIVEATGQPAEEVGARIDQAVRTLPHAHTDVRPHEHDGHYGPHRHGREGEVVKV